MVDSLLKENWLYGQADLSMIPIMSPNRDLQKIHLKTDLTIDP